LETHAFGVRRFRRLKQHTREASMHEIDATMRKELVGYNYIRGSGNRAKV
jgi:hypothetical protein